MNKMALEEYKGVFIYAQQVDNEISSIAFELIGKGKELAKDLDTDVTAVLLGSNVKGLADQLAEYGADQGYRCGRSDAGSLQNRALRSRAGCSDQRVQAGDHAGGRYRHRT